MTDLRTRFDAWMEIHDNPENPATPAATVILVRDSAEGPQVLMVQRSAKGSFASSWVFPGGKIDPEDYLVGAAGDIIAASRVAACREAAEEADVAVPHDSLVAMSHWMPPKVLPRRFATWFFVAHAPSGTDGVVSIDGGEIVDHLWVRPEAALDMHGQGQVELMPPTWMSLNELSDHPDATAAVAAVGASDFAFYSTRRLPTDPPIVCWTGDAAYESGDPEAPGPRHRLTLSPGGWTLER